MKKILSVAVPCYNSEAYMKRCIESLLVGGEEVEIIIVNDGSTDRTGEIADSYVKKYPKICKAVHQKNGGHGEAVNAGLRNAAGYFFKVVDSDDRVGKEAFGKLLDVMRKAILEEHPLDMLISNYVYDKVGAKRKKVMKYTDVLPVDSFFTWDEVGHFKQDKYIIMHSVIYRTELLRECGLELPKHTFYVDNIFMFQPLPYVKTMYYADVNFYWYFIGRDDQSVHQSVMIKRIDQQIRVNKLMIDYFNPEIIEYKKCKKYMIHYLEIILAISSIMCILSHKPENFAKKKELWRYLKEMHPSTHRKLKRNPMGFIFHIPGKTGRAIAILIYKVVQKIFNFN